MEDRWYVVHSKPNMEQFLAGQLESRQIIYYLPLLTVKPKNPRCKKSKPYFPGYLFIHADDRSANRLLIERTPGVAGLVNFGGEVAFVPDTILNTIRQKVEQINFTDAETCRKFSKGEKLKIHSGPFAGYDAIFNSSIDGRDRVRVLLTLVEKRMLTVELPVAHVI